MSEIFRGNIESETIVGLTDDEKKSIYLRAGLRRNTQDFKVNLLNLKIPEAGEDYKSKYEKTLALVKKEADGAEIIKKSEAEEMLIGESEALLKEAESFKEIAPNQSEYLLAYLSKLEEAAGKDYFTHHEEAREMGKDAASIPKMVPANLLNDAILMGIERRSHEKMPLPEMKKIAEAVLHDQKLLENYALILKENERDEFIRFIPEDKKREISIILDTQVAGLLHQSLVEKKTPEEEQRRMVRMRLFRELQESLAGGEKNDKKTVKILGASLGELGEDSRQLLLELIRDENDSRIKTENGLSEVMHLPRIMKIMLDNFDDLRANDIILRTAGTKELNPHLSAYLFKKLIDKNYLDKDVGKWWESQKDKKTALDIIKKTISELGVVPNSEVLDFVANDKVWKKSGKILEIDKRFKDIQESQKEFADIENINDLIEILSRDENKAMIFYLLHGGEDRFNLINNYDFGKFKEIIEIVSRFEIHEKPLEIFTNSLLKSGLSKTEANEITKRLIGGHFPLGKHEQAYQETSFEISENAALVNANKELGVVLGKNQLGTVLTFPIYREYLEKENNGNGRNLLGDMSKSATFQERIELIEKINFSFPDYKTKIKEGLGDSWVKFGEKMVLELTLDQVLSSDEISIKGQELLPRLDVKRIDLKRINKELIVALKSENKAIKDIGQEIKKKKKARMGLAKGLEFQIDESKKEKMTLQIAGIENDIASLEREHRAFGEMKVDERFSNLSPEKKKKEIDRLSGEIIALTEKSPSAIFTYIAMQVLGEKRLNEGDINLIREMESHLQGPFQTISDLLNYERGKETDKKRMKVGLEYLDKTERFMNMVRFADSKICCFSSSNYNMVVAHETPNKEWVASINADPLSFVISIEIPQEKIEGKRNIKENIGFIFGNYGVNEKNEPAILLNGIYYAPGIENILQVEAILNGVERIFEGLPVKNIAVASQYGGSSVGGRLPSDYSSEPIELTRLRALDNGQGRPENKIYDDLGTGSDLNRLHSYGGYVWHKNL